MHTEVQKPPLSGAFFLFAEKETALAPLIMAGIWILIVIAASAAWILNGGIESISSETIPVERDDK